jgi:hypothetical protein
VAFFENLNKMTEQKKNILRSLLLMQLQGGSITRAEYNQQIAAISPPSVTPSVVEGLAAQDVKPQCIAAQDAKPQCITAQPVQPHQQSAIESIDKEKARLCNMLHTVATNKSAKHITDKILALRLKRKEAYTNTRIADAAAAVEPQCIAANGNGIAANGNEIAANSNANGITTHVSPYRQAENLRIKIMRWEKKLATDPDNFELKQKLQDAKADYKSLRA